MDKILSVRVDETVIHQLGILARELNMTKKSIIEEAIKLYSEQTKQENKTDVLANTFGAWQRSESVDETILNSCSAFNNSMGRHHQ